MEIVLIKTAPIRSVVRCRSAAAGGVNAVCHTYNGGVSQVGHDVIASPQVVPVYWGDTVSNDAALKSALDQFFGELLNSDFVDRLSQYGIANPIVHTSREIAGNVSTVSSQDVANNLVTWFQNGSVPAPSPLSDASNWLYIILAPAGATVGSPGECGYHSNSSISFDGQTLDLAWALIAFPTPGAGAQATDIINSFDYCLGHEMVEAFSNPRGNGWSVNVPASGGNAGQNCEIGDLCETKTFHAIGRWQLETYWSNQDNGCVAGYDRIWNNLGRPAAGVLGAPIVVANADQRLELFVVGDDGSLNHAWQTAPSGPWSPWNGLAPASTLASGPARASANQDGRIEIFGMQSGGVLWHIWQTAPNNGWSAGGVLGQPGTPIVGSAAVGKNQDGRLEVFGVGQDKALHHIWQTSPNNGWSSWSSLAAPPPGIDIGDPRVINNQDGRLEVFVQAADGNVWHVWQTAPNNGWSSWSSLGIPPAGVANGAPFVGRNSDGRLELFVTGDDGNLYHMWQLAPNSGWSTWVALTTPLTIELFGLGTVSNDSSGSLRVLTIGADGALWTIAQSVPSNGWGNWRFLDGAPRAQALNGDQIPAASLQANGIFSAFVLGEDGNIWTIAQTTPNGPWGPMITS